jgi:O-antigen ligase
MSLTLAAFLLVYLALAIASFLKHPIFGLIGYYITYVISPATRWWGEGLASRGFRYSYVIAFIAIAGWVAYTIRKRTENSFSLQEIWLWLFVGAVWFSGLHSPPILGGENQAIKLAKAALMLFVLKRSVTDLSKFRWFIWALVLATIYGALDTRLVAQRLGSRISTGAGGSDFIEGNFLAAHLAMMLPFVGVLFLRSHWVLKAFLATSAAVVVDVIIQCRSRGAFLAILAGGCVALVFSPRKTRKAIYALIIMGAIGAFSLVDSQFLERMSLIKPNMAIEQQDTSSAGRIQAWRAAISMSKDNPLGVGYNNFRVRVADYNIAIPGKDTHNTFLRCLAELGIQGLLLLLLLSCNALLRVYRLHKQLYQEAEHAEYALWNYATGVGLVVYLVAGVFISTTYIEEFYIILLLPDIIASLVRGIVKTDSNALDRNPERTS